MKKKVLLVEDNEDNRDLVMFILKSAGLDIQLHAAENGEEAIALAIEHLPDLILMDLEMPVLDGWQAVSRLKADRRTEAIPVVALTAAVKPQDKLRSKEIGCIEHMSKPMVPEDLIALVRRYLEA